MKMGQTADFYILMVDKSEMIRSKISRLGRPLYPAVICSEIYQQTLLSVPETDNSLRNLHYTFVFSLLFLL